MHVFKGYIGTYTNGESRGIYAFELNTEKKELSRPVLVAELENPAYLTISADNRRLFSVIKKGALGGIAAYTIENGRLKRLGEQLSEGAAPCYVSVDPKNRYVVSANYHRGTVDLYSVGGKNGIMALLDRDIHRGKAADPQRQAEPHVHFADFTPNEKFIVTIDLGTDQMTTYRVLDGRLSVQHVLHFAPGTGPRHVTFHPSLPYAYVMSELSNEVIGLHVAADTGIFSIFQTIGTLPVDFRGHSQGSAIKISSDGRFVYVSNRGHNSITVFQADKETGRLALVEHVFCGGDWPRDFEIDPSGRFLIAANQNSGSLTLFERDAASGRLSAVCSDIAVPDPTCIKFLHI